MTRILFSKWNEVHPYDGKVHPHFGLVWLDIILLPNGHTEQILTHISTNVTTGSF
jgi:hypothetical protein